MGSLIVGYDCDRKFFLVRVQSEKEEILAEGTYETFVTFRKKCEKALQENENSSNEKNEVEGSLEKFREMRQQLEVEIQRHISDEEWGRCSLGLRKSGKHRMKLKL